MASTQNPKRVEPFRHEGHRRPVTRRDFLAQGFLTGAAFIASPSLFGALRGGGAAYAQAMECGISAGAGLIPFVCFDLAGGASVAGSNVLVGGPAGQLDSLSEAGYLKLGLPADMLPSLPGQVNTELGLAFHSDSAFLRGMLSKMSQEARDRTNGSVICARSDNDTGNNPHNPMYGINKAGADGALVTLIGTEASESGGKSAAPQAMVDPAVRPVKVDRPSDATGLVDTGKLVELLNQQDAGAVMLAMEKLSERKLEKITETAVLEELIRCNYVQSTHLVETFGNPDALDPNNDPDIVGQATSILTAGEMGTSDFRKTASVMELAVNGFAGAATIEFGGYDYHDSTRATGEIKDFRAGQAMGAVIEYAHRKGQQLMLYVFSDGSLVSDGVLDSSADGRGKAIWKSDNSGAAATFFLVYDPAGRPALAAPDKQQIGYFRTSGSNETGATRVSNNVTLLAEAIVLNYMALHDDVGRFASALPMHGLGQASELDELIAFAPIRSVTA